MSGKKVIDSSLKIVNGKMGFIPLLRKPFRESEVFRSGAHDLFALLLFLIFKAAPEEKKFYIGPILYDVKRGVVVQSQVGLAVLFKCNRKTINKLLRRLVELKEISMETRMFKGYKKVSVFKVLRYDHYVWKAGAPYQDMKTLLGLGGYVMIDREHILSMKEIRRKNFQEWVLFIYLCVAAFHSVAEIELPAGKTRFQRGQFVLEIDRLNALMNKDGRSLTKSLKKLERKKLLTLKLIKHQAGPETLIITIDTYDYFVQNLKEMDNGLDNDLGEGTEIGVAAELATSDNVFDNSPDNLTRMKGKNIGELPAVVLYSSKSPEVVSKAEEEEEEKAELVAEMWDWTYDKENGFYEKTDPDTYRKQLGHVVDRVGVWGVRNIFERVKEAKPWGDFDSENKCALTELWEQLKFEQRRIERPAPKIVKVPEKKYIRMDDPLREAIFLLEHLNSLFNEKLGIETIAVCLLLDKNYIGWTGYSLGMFKVEHAEVLGISMSTMHRIIARLLQLGLLEKDKATNRVRFHSFWYDLRKRFIEEIKDKKGGKDEKKDIC